MISAPTVGPGHDDLKIRPWNEEATVGRDWGRHYDRMFGEAVGAFADLVTIMSFNGWTEVGDTHAHMFSWHDASKC